MHKTYQLARTSMSRTGGVKSKFLQDEVDKTSVTIHKTKMLTQKKLYLHTA